MSTPPYSPSLSPEEPVAADSSPGAIAAIRVTESPPPRTVGIIIWAVLSILIVGYISFGSITTRFWQLDVYQQAWTQQVASRKVLHVWMYQLNHLPYSSSAMLLKVGFGGALLVIVLGVVMSIWLILHQEGDMSGSVDTSTPPSTETDAS